MQISRIFDQFLNLARETKNLNFDICKISSGKCKINSADVEFLNFLSEISKLLF